ncbi:GNAT family N-acetyltransferase [Hoyosella sp. YIM 151337]|uniref:GNAT family N-acetyltransferase n=1 Tax=Hoyosella sp. YIM 151337 TaxID=2992742 RepID=UPI00223641E7|nr:GNAT family N-acetyltransferase [Hoyosella sp. YIM 151337]MCW4356009.1 GNAT family N-acetyltransferase [Hoyosella sp. YIM 151337]
MTTETGSAIEVRTATDDDWPHIVKLDSFSFGTHIVPLKASITRELAPNAHVLVATIGGQVVGVTMHYELQITVPGGALIDLPGISWVSVAATHRRRGILRTMLAEQHRRFTDAGAPMAVLTASEGGIYGRFGYGPITTEFTHKLDRRFAEFRDSAVDPGGVRLLTKEEAEQAVPAIYDRWRRQHAGALGRPAAFWRGVFADPEEGRNGASALFFLLHDDGYVSYRVRTGESMSIEVADFFAVTPGAYIALWRTLCGLDLMQTITVSDAPDALLPYLLKNPRLPQLTGSYDLLWARILDFAGVLRARSYASEIDVVLEITDDFLGQGGVFRLTSEGNGANAKCERADELPRLRISAGDLASVYFGEHRALSLAQAGRIWVPETDLLEQFDRAFATTAAPRGGMFF